MSQKQCVVFKIYNNPNIEQLGVCSVKLRHKDKFTRYRFFVILSNGPALSGMSDLEMIEENQVGRKFDSQRNQPAF